MGANFEVNQVNDELVVKISNNLEFSDFEEFGDKIMQPALAENVKSIHLHLDGMAGVDSAGLGLFLLLREKTNTESRKCPIVLHNPKGQVAKMLHHAKFADHFSILGSDVRA